VILVLCPALAPAPQRGRDRRPMAETIIRRDGANQKSRQYRSNVIITNENEERMNLPDSDPDFSRFIDLVIKAAIASSLIILTQIAQIKGGDADLFKSAIGVGISMPLCVLVIYNDYTKVIPSHKILWVKLLAISSFLSGLTWLIFSVSFFVGVIFAVSCLLCFLFAVYHHMLRYIPQPRKLLLQAVRKPLENVFPDGFVNRYAEFASGLFRRFRRT
jgi:hypothetical protein